MYIRSSVVGFGTYIFGIHLITFWGYDNTFEASVFITSDAGVRSSKFSRNESLIMALNLESDTKRLVADFDVRILTRDLYLFLMVIFKYVLGNVYF